MGMTIVEKILTRHVKGRTEAVTPGEIIDVSIDARVARDFGGANVVKNLRDHQLGIADPTRTRFTFDCNPGGSDQSYANNQQICRTFAREQGVSVHDVNAGIGTHLAIDLGFVGPGETFISTDSHANILGSIGAFGQGMGDQDVAHAFAHGTVWFKVPPTTRVRLEGMPSPLATAKDATLALCRRFGAAGLLGHAAEIYGPYIDQLDLAGRVTLASMCTEMGGIILFVPPNESVLAHCRLAADREVSAVYADVDAAYADEITVDIAGLEPVVARPGHPDDAVPIAEVAGTKIDSVFIGSCTNGRYEDLAAAAKIIAGRETAPGVVLKVVPSTDEVWRRLLSDGLLETFKRAGALVGSAGCAGCAAGQIGQNGPGETTVSTGNRNYPGKQGKGLVYLASPETAAASALAGVICRADAIPERPVVFSGERDAPAAPSASVKRETGQSVRPAKVRGRAWVIERDNVDTDMIYHNRYLTLTDPEEMKRHALDNLEGWEDFASRVRPGDVVIAGKNFGCGSSRQQAVDCFKALGVAALVAESFAAIYERNAINAGFPILTAPLAAGDDRPFADGDEVIVDLESGAIAHGRTGAELQGRPMSPVQLEIYRRGGLLGGGRRP